LTLATLSACAGGEGTRLFAPPNDAAAAEQAEENRPNVALKSADMARGAIALTPPDGFCIDKTALKQTFAVLARCDSLGGVGGALDAPLGMIVVSIAQAPDQSAPQVTAAQLVPSGSAVLDTKVAGDFTVLHLSGDTPQGTDTQHWRGLIQIGAHLMSLSAFGPEDGRMAGGDGGVILASLAQRTQDASIAADVAKASKGQNRTGMGRVLSGLFD